jgi:hypothetical protein
MKCVHGFCVKCKYFHRHDPLALRILEAEDEMSIATYTLIRMYIPYCSYRRLVLLWTFFGIVSVEMGGICGMYGKKEIAWRVLIANPKETDASKTSA